MRETIEHLFYHCIVLLQLPTPTTYTFSICSCCDKVDNIPPFDFQTFLCENKIKLFVQSSPGHSSWWFCVWNLLHPNNIINPLLRVCLKFTADFLRRLKSHFQVVFVGNLFSLNTNIFQASLLQNYRNYSLPGNRS